MFLRPPLKKVDVINNVPIYPLIVRVCAHAEQPVEGRSEINNQEDFEVLAQGYLERPASPR